MNDSSVACLDKRLALISQLEVENKGFIASGIQNDDGFTILVSDGQKDLGYLSMAYEVKTRKFKTLDALYKQAQKLGFRKVMVNLP